jgi:uncharacterized phage protein gp47/JayE
MSSFPLPTLSVEITDSGITAPSYDDILNSITTQMKQIFGSDLYLGPDSQEGQMIAIFALAQHDTNQSIIRCYNDRSPSFAQGAGLSSVVKINGLARKVSSKSTAILTIVGVSGTPIVSGIAQDSNGNQWALPLVVTIPSSGGIDVTAIAVADGAIPAAAGTINRIATPTLGWQSVTNAVDATVGNAIETDAELRQRQTQSTSLPAQTPLQSILAAVANIEGIKRSAIYENSTSIVDANGLPDHSIAVVVDGGDPTTVAQTIESKKAPGTGTFGSTNIGVQDPAGLPVTINFFNLVDVAIYVNITIRPMIGYVDSIADAVAQAIADFINAIPIGDSVYYNWVLAAASLNSDIRFRVTSLTIGVAPNPVGVADVFIAFNQAAVTSIDNIVVSVG